MSRLLRFFVVLAATFGSWTVLPAPAVAEVWRVSFFLQAELPVVNVWIGTRGPFRFVVDTGAEGSTVSEELATSLGLRVEGAIEQQTPTGTARRFAVVLSDFHISRDTPATGSFVVAVSNLAALRRSAPSVDGVLGADVLGTYDYLLDFDARTLTLARGESLSARGGVTLPLHVDRHRPIVGWPRRRTPLFLVLDSGADALILDAAEASSFKCRSGTRQRLTLETHTDRREVLSCQLEPVRVGALEIEGLRMVGIGWPSPLERLDRGLLPAAVFGRIYVSPSRGTVTFWPRTRASLARTN